MPTIHTISDVSELQGVSGGFPGTNQVPRPRRPPPGQDALDEYFGRHVDKNVDPRFPIVNPPAMDQGFERSIDAFAPPPSRQDS